MSEKCSRASWRGQLSPVGIAIGCVGCVIITASSVYTALKMGALPWPTIFTSIVALFLLRAFGRRSLNEANVTQIVMSAGSMVAGGLAFTIPGIWMLGAVGEVSWIEMLVVALAGTLLGLVCTAAIRRRFVDESDLEYPIGTAAAETASPTPKSAATDVGPTSTSMSVNEAPSTSKVGAKGSPETVDTPSAVLTPPSPPPVWTLSDAEPRRASPIVRAASELAGTARAKATLQQCLKT